jgi:heme A synthase
MTRFQRLALGTAAITYLLVVIGATVRATGSGMGCPDWPLCYGQLLPPLGDNAAWIEWIHRTVAAVVGLLVLAMAVVAVRVYRRRRSIVLTSLGALVLVIVQAWLGMVTVATNNAGEWVTIHLAAALVLLAPLSFIFIRSLFPARMPERGRSQRLTLVLAFGTGRRWLVGLGIGRLMGTLSFVRRNYHWIAGVSGILLVAIGFLLALNLWVPLLSRLGLLRLTRAFTPPI